jgi:hypothetical protein
VGRSWRISIWILSRMTMNQSSTQLVNRLEDTLRIPGGNRAKRRRVAALLKATRKLQAHHGPRTKAFLEHLRERK